MGKMSNQELADWVNARAEANDFQDENQDPSSVRRYTIGAMPGLDTLAQPAPGHTIGHRQTTTETRYVVKDSGKRQEFASGMVRDTQENKIEYDRAFDGVLIDRLAAHLTKGAAKYPDNEDGTPNWTLAEGQTELRRFRKSAARHFRQWLRGDQDEDHFSAVVFNMNGYETTKGRL